MDAIKILFLTNNKTHYARTCRHRYIRYSGPMGGMEIQNSSHTSINFNRKKDFFPTNDYINISEVVRDFPQINEISITSAEQYQEVIDAFRNDIKSIPVFIKDLNNEINIIPARHDEIQVEPGFKLMYLGKKLSF